MKEERLKFWNPERITTTGKSIRITQMRFNIIFVMRTNSAGVSLHVSRPAGWRFLTDTAAVCLGITANANHFRWLTVALANLVQQLILGFAERAMNVMLVLVRL